jgi:hypothetical protein
MKYYPLMDIELMDTCPHPAVSQDQDMLCLLICYASSLIALHLLEHLACCILQMHIKEDGER